MSITEILIKALSNTVLGMGTVFLVLIFISFIISMLPKITGAIENMGKKKEEAPAADSVPAAPVVEEEEEELVDDLELVAIITAAIAASTGSSTDGFVVRSIRKSAKNNWKRV